MAEHRLAAPMPEYLPCCGIQPALRSHTVSYSQACRPAALGCQAQVGASYKRGLCMVNYTGGDAAKGRAA